MNPFEQFDLPPDFLAPMDAQELAQFILCEENDTPEFLAIRGGLETGNLTRFTLTDCVMQVREVQQAHIRSQTLFPETLRGFASLVAELLFVSAAEDTDDEDDDLSPFGDAA